MAIATAMSGDGDDIFSGDALNVLVQMRARDENRVNERRAGEGGMEREGWMKGRN